MTGHTAPLPDGFSPTTFQHGFSAHWFDVDRDPADRFVDVVLNAISVGYRRFDCNPVWDTESMIGAAIEQSSLPRGELFVTTVVPFDQPVEEPTRHQLGNVATSSCPQDSSPPPSARSSMEQIARRGRRDPGRVARSR